MGYPGKLFVIPEDRIDLDYWQNSMARPEMKVEPEPSDMPCSPDKRAVGVRFGDYSFLLASRICDPFEEGPHVTGLFLGFDLRANPKTDQAYAALKEEIIAKLVQAGAVPIDGKEFKKLIRERRKSRRQSKGKKSLWSWFNK